MRILCLLLLTLFNCVCFAETTTTTTTVERKTIITPVPVAKETIATPEGSVVCVTVDASWTGNVWIPTHRVCQYSNQPSGVAWVEGYWSCTEYTVATGECTKWAWNAGHWEQNLSFY